MRALSAQSALQLHEVPLTLMMYQGGASTWNPDRSNPQMRNVDQSKMVEYTAAELFPMRPLLPSHIAMGQYTSEPQQISNFAPSTQAARLPIKYVKVEQDHPPVNRRNFANTQQQFEKLALPTSHGAERAERKGISYFLARDQANSCDLRSQTPVNAPLQRNAIERRSMTLPRARTATPVAKLPIPNRCRLAQNRPTLERLDLATSDEATARAAYQRAHERSPDNYVLVRYCVAKPNASRQLAPTKRPDGQSSGALGQSSVALGSDRQFSGAQGPYRQSSGAPGPYRQSSEPPGPNRQFSEAPQPYRQSFEAQGPYRQASESPGPNRQFSEAPQPYRQSSEAQGPYRQSSEAQSQYSQTLRARGPNRQFSGAQSQYSQTLRARGPNRQFSEARSQYSQTLRAQSLIRQFSEAPQPYRQSSEAQGPYRQSCEAQGPTRQSSESPGPYRQASESPGPNRQFSEAQGPTRQSSGAPGPYRQSFEAQGPYRQSSEAQGPTRQSSGAPQPYRQSSESPAPYRQASESPGPTRQFSGAPGPNRQFSEAPQPHREFSETLGSHKVFRTPPPVPKRNFDGDRERGTEQSSIPLRAVSTIVKELEQVFLQKKSGGTCGTVSRPLRPPPPRPARTSRLPAPPPESIEEYAQFPGPSNGAQCEEESGYLVAEPPKVTDQSAPEEDASVRYSKNLDPEERAKYEQLREAIFRHIPEGESVLEPEYTPIEEHLPEWWKKRCQTLPERPILVMYSNGEWELAMNLGEFESAEILKSLESELEKLSENVPKVKTALAQSDVYDFNVTLRTEPWVPSIALGAQGQLWKLIDGKLQKSVAPDSAAKVLGKLSNKHGLTPFWDLTAAKRLMQFTVCMEIGLECLKEDDLKAAFAVYKRIKGNLALFTPMPGLWDELERVGSATSSEVKLNSAYRLGRLHQLKLDVKADLENSKASRPYKAILEEMITELIEEFISSRARRDIIFKTKLEERHPENIGAAALHYSKLLEQISTRGEEPRRKS